MEAARRMKKLIVLTGPHALLTSGTLCFSSADAVRLYLRLSRSAVMLCSRSERRSHRAPSAVSVGAHPNAARRFLHLGVSALYRLIIFNLLKTMWHPNTLMVLKN